MSEYEIVKHQKIRGLSIFLNTVDYRRPHEHSEWELIWVLENSLIVTCDSTQTVLQPGQMVLFSPHELHELRMQKGSCTFLCMQLSPSVLPIQPHYTMVRRYPHLEMSEKHYRQLKKSFFHAAQSFFTGKPLYEMYCLGQCMLTLSTLLEYLPMRNRTPAEIMVVKERNARIERMMQFVEENYTQRLRLSDLAQQEGCSVSHLSRLIREYTGQTFQQYVEYVRFVNACILIASGQMKMLDVCVESGFSDYRYFTRAFRQYLNVTPEEYAHRGQKAHSSATMAHSSHTGERILSVEESLEFINTLRKSIT